MSRSTVGILPAAGAGRRFGAAKQFLDLGGAPLLVHAARAMDRSPSIDAWVVAVPPGEEERVERILRACGAKKLAGVVAGGAERADSVRRAIAAAPEAELLVIHDAARPFATPELFERVIEAARREGAAIAALPCTDTVKEVGDGKRVARTLDRSRLWLAQTPQAFRADWLAEAYERLGERANAFTDEAGLVEAAGRPVALVEGERENFKVTEPKDWDRARARYLPPMAVGMGTDVHGFAEGRRCILGGLHFPGEVGLAGHSDADVVLHALMDAILGAAGLGDIGLLFPDTREDLRGADSAGLLAEVVQRATAEGWTIGNADVTILAKRPRIGPRREEMRERIASLLGIPPARVNVKATTTEGLGFVGRGEGIACQAVVLLLRDGSGG
jgi:2-C-methyl-D-erythritol 4-phosphate cytidylyltransferase/2-C-methyl-D-erythritol 2,4-cyclodiphosphate synthase